MTGAFETTDWKLTPERTVLVNIDDQNDFLHEDGAYAKGGVDISHMQRVIEPTNELVAACRTAGIPIIWTTHGTHGAVDAGPFFNLRPLLKDGGLRIGTWGYELADAMDADDSDWIVAKYRHSAFFETNLDLSLRALKADTVLITGVLTNQCVGATTKDALYRDYKPIVVEECTGTAFPELHDPAIAMIRAGWGQVNTLAPTLDEISKLSKVAA
jgi:ureidoacrylate peracid hydrolase